MLNEIKLKDYGKLIITDYDNDIQSAIKNANMFIKRILFVNEEPKEYIINISYTRALYIKEKNINRYDSDITKAFSKSFNFEFEFCNIDKNSKTYHGKIQIDEFGNLIEWYLYETTVVTTNEYQEPICVNLNKQNTYSLDINGVSINDGLLKFNDDNAKISVINNLKKKLKEN